MAFTRGRVVGAAVGVVFAVLTVGTAEAAPAVRLVYSRTPDAESCPDEDALRSAVAARVGYDAFFPWAKRSILATITRSDGAFVASVDLVDESGIRHGGHQLRTTGACGELLDAVALAVAIAIDPQLILAQAAPQAPPPPPPPATPQLPPELPQPAPPEPAPPPILPRPTRVVFEGSLGATAGLGFAPEPSLGTTLGVDLRWPRFSFGLEGFIAAPLTHAATATSEGNTYSSWPTLVSFVPCVPFGRFFACTILQTGTLHSEASQVQSSSSTWWVAAGGRIGAALPVSDRLSLRFRLDVLADLSPPELVLNGQQPGHGPWTAFPIAGSVGVDAVVRFW